MKRYRLSQTAAQEIEETWLHIALDDPVAADSQLEAFHGKFRLLAEHPEVGRQRPELSADIRSLAAGNYVILYLPYTSEKGCVEIAHVLHGARDLKESL